MQAYLSTSVADCPTGRSAIDLPRVRPSALRFWLPLAVIGVALYIAQHDITYTSPAYEEGGRVEDLVTDVSSSSLSRQLAFISLGLMGGLLIAAPARQPLATSRGHLFLFLASGACVMTSALWADDFPHSLKQCMVPLLCGAAALGVTKHWQPRQVCLFVAALTGTFLMVGILAECAASNFLHGDEYRFAGTLHSNNQAVNCAALFLASLSLFYEAREQHARGRSTFWLLVAVIGLVFLLLTRARTATIALLPALVMFVFLGVSGRKRLLLVGGLAMIVCASAVLVLESADQNANPLVELLKMGRDQDTDEVASLTGRVPIWAEVVADVAKRPLLGYGYGDFWTSERILQYSYIHDWMFDHAHSAYLETLLNVGSLGLIVGLAVVGLAIWRAARGYGATHDPGFRFIAVLLAMAMVHGLVDSNFVREGFELILGMICVAAVCLHGGRSIQADEPLLEDPRREDGPPSHV
ncbi:MAG: O-antigen ligase [Pirellulales bacterium]